MLKRSSLVLLFTLIIAACGGGGSSSGNNEPAVTSILAIGDSIGTGAGIAAPWPARIENALGVPVINDSRNSRRTDQIVNQVPELLDTVMPSHMVVLLGTNDANSGSVTGAVANLQAMVDAANQRGVIAVIGTVLPNRGVQIEDERAAQISEGIRMIVGARIAEVRGAFGDGSTLLSSDGKHPDNGGQEVITNEFLIQLQ